MSAGVLVEPSSSGPFNKLPLSPRERQVSALYAEGWTIPQIADSLGIKPSTVSERLDTTRIKYKNAGRAFTGRLGLQERLTEDGILPL